MDMLVCGEEVHYTVSPLEHLLYPQFRFQSSANLLLIFHVSGQMNAQKYKYFLKTCLEQQMRQEVDLTCKSTEP